MLDVLVECVVGQRDLQPELGGVPSCGSMPSVKEYPRRRMRVPSLYSELARRMCAVAGMTGRPSRPLAVRLGW